MRTPAFLQTRVERLERAGDVAGIVAILADHHQKTYERAHAAKALAELHEPTALPAFHRAALDGDWMIRVFAAHGFDRLRAQDSLVELVGLLADRESGVREAAAAALASVGDGRVRPLLERAAVTDPYPWVREAARDALIVVLSGTPVDE